MKTLCIRINNCSFEKGRIVVVSSQLSGSPEQLGQPTDHSGESEPFGGSRILNLKVRPSGQSGRGRMAGALPRALTFERKPARAGSKRIGSRPAIGLRSNPWAAFFLNRCSHYPVMPGIAGYFRGNVHSQPHRGSSGGEIL